ncbi:MAG: tetratricopeptide repeat protein [Elusimicrobiota bacterium]
MNHKDTKARKTDGGVYGESVAVALLSVRFLRLGAFAAILSVHPICARAAEAPQESKAVVLQKYYDQAFAFYKSGDYGRAIQVWDDILRLDPDQKTARDMIREVQNDVEKTNAKRLTEILANVRTGRYRSALAGLETLLENGNRTPFASALQSSLEDIVLIVPEAPDKSKAWRLTTLSVNAAVGQNQDYKLAYDGLRYARELEPVDTRIKRLLDWFLSRHPEFVNTDLVTPGMTLLEYKRSVALDHMYGARYHQAIDTLNEALALEPADLVALKRLGSAYYSLGLHPKAREAWQKALALSPEDPQLKKFLRKLSSRPAPAEAN